MVRGKIGKIKACTIPPGGSSILKNPTTVKTLARQIVSASDDYIAMRMDEKEFRELIVHYARYHGKKLFSYTRPGLLNPTIQNRIGKKRMQLVELMLDGFQSALV